MIRQYIRDFTQAAQAKGIRHLNFYMEERRSRGVAVYEGELEQLERCEQTQLFIQGEVDGLSGSVFVENFDPTLMEGSIQCILDSARAGSAPFVPYQLEKLENVVEEMPEFIPLDRAVEALEAGEKAAYAADSRIIPGVQVHLTEQSTRVTLADEEQRFVSDLTGGGMAGLRLVVREDGQVQPGGKMTHFPAGELPDLADMAQSAADEAVSRLGAVSWQSGSFPVVLDSKVTAELLDAFMPAFFASNVQSHMSALDGRMGTSVAGENITICEDPAVAGGLRRRRFDDEGVPTSAKEIVAGGQLRCWLHSRATAAKDGAVSGGNGFKSRFQDPVAVGYTNVVIRPGEKSLEELMADMGEGLLITSVSGVFAGAHPTTGLFSLIAQGYEVTGGKRGRPVTRITIAGNFFEMLEHVTAIGGDAHWKLAEHGCVCTPSLLVSALAISGEEK